MKETDRVRFSKVLARLAAIYDKQLGEETASSYWDALRGLSIEEVEAAASKLTVTAERFPLPVHFVNAARGNPAERAEAAWQLAWSKVFRVGSYVSPTFDDPAIIATIREMGGWPAFCRPDAAEHFHRQRFVGLYQGFDARRDMLPEPTQLRGLHEQENMARGLTAPEESVRELPAGPPTRRLGDGRPN